MARASSICDALSRMLAAASGRALVSVMLANNETGAIQPVAEVARIAHEAGAIVHCDAVQAAGRLPVDIAALGVDTLSLSAHKIGGPQGAGAIVRASDEVTFAPLLTGGGQEFRTRAGTENVAAIAGFGAAATAALADLDRHRRMGRLARPAGGDRGTAGDGVQRQRSSPAPDALPGGARGSGGNPCNCTGSGRDRGVFRVGLFVRQGGAEPCAGGNGGAG